MFEFFTIAGNVLSKTFLDPAKSIMACILAVLGFAIGDPSQPVLATIFLLIAIDWGTGIAKAVFQKNLNSAKMLQGGVKLIIYLCLLALAYHLPRINGAIFVFADNVIYAYIGIAEAVSILENIQELCDATGIKIPFIAVLCKCLRSHEKAMIEKLESQIPKLEEKVDGKKA